MLSRLIAESKKELEPSIVEAHRTLSRAIIAPIWITLTIGFYATYFTYGLKFYVACGLGLAFVCFNIYCSLRRPPSLPGAFDLSDERMICARWVVNFTVLASAQLYLIRPAPTAALAIWVPLMVMAQLESFRRGFRAIIFVVSTLAFVGLSMSMYDNLTFREYVLVTICLVCLIAAFFSIEAGWLMAMGAAKKAQQRETEAVYEANSLATQATLLQQTRILMHDLRNLAAVVEMVDKLSKPEITGTIQKFVDKIDALNSIFAELPFRSAERIVAVHELLQSLNFMLKKISSDGVKVKSHIAPGTFSLKVKEGRGSIYFCIHSLIRLACEQVKASSGEGTVALKVWRDGNHLLFEVKLAPSLASSPSPKKITSQVNDKQMVLRLVRSECERSAFKFELNRLKDKELLITIGIPIYGDDENVADVA